MTLLNADGLTLLRQIVARIDDVVFIVAPDAERILYVSPSYEQVWGRSCQSLYADSASWMEAIHPDDREQTKATITRPNSEMEVRHEFRIVRPDGAVRWIRTRTCALLDEYGQVRRLVGIAQDRTERRRAELVRREADAKFTRVVETITDAFLALGPDWRCAYANPVSERLLRRERAELLGSVLWEIFPEMSAGKFSEDCRRAVRERVTIRGEAFWPALQAWHEHVVYPTPDGATLLLHDVTPQKKTEAALAQSTAILLESQRQLALAQEIAQLGSFHWLIAEDRLTWSDESLRILGREREAAPQTIEDYLKCVHAADRDATRSTFAEAAEAGESRNWEMRIVRPSGEIRTLLLNLLVATGRSADVREATGTQQDITERRVAEEKQRIIERKLIETHRLESLGLLASGIAHDFNNLLTGVLGNASLARHEISSASEVRSCLDQIETLALRAADLCQQLHACSGKNSALLQHADLSKLVTKTANLLRLAIGPHARLEFDLAAELPLIEADAVQLEQAILNLVINASEALQDRPGTIVLRTGSIALPADEPEVVFISAAPPPADYISLEVVDTGCGVDPKFLPDLFEPFFTTKLSGRGLGLPATLGIVRSHKGALSVRSNPQTGSAFRILLPPCQTEPKIPHRALEAGDWQARGTILIVDDEESVRRVAGRLLASFGFDVLLASSGAGALAIYRDKADEISAVLLDLTMPEMDGVETFHEIRRLRANARVILMSGYAEKNALARLDATALAGFVQKPFTAQSLCERMKAAVLA
ncbi:MAG: PAS domain-containing protein [Verrucomicrobia bacterium]|nr:PAS domain-containing protein [Verrucomicrobiota bacterium]